tara:strand:+ start:1774 stop:2814 length:1041 start_codon:yes stop_codon:yes gene_type:complete
MVEDEPKGWGDWDRRKKEERFALAEIDQGVRWLRSVILAEDDENRSLYLKRNLTRQLRKGDLLELEMPSRTIPDLPSESDLREEIRVLLLENSGLSPKYAYSNQLLDDIVKIKPRTKSDLRKIKGMGTRRMESSDEILQIIEKWLMRRCRGSIVNNIDSFTIPPTFTITHIPTHEILDEILPVTPEILDEISVPFVEWKTGRKKNTKRIPIAETKKRIMEEMRELVVDYSTEVPVYALKESLEKKGIHIQSSRLSQVITSLVDDGLILRKKPVPYKKGVVLLQLTERGLAEKIMKFLNERGEADTEEILEHVNSTMRHGTKPQQLGKVLSKDEDILSPFEDSENKF